MRYKIDSQKLGWEDYLHLKLKHLCTCDLIQALVAQTTAGDKIAQTFDTT